VYSLFPIYFITVQSLKTPHEDVFGSPLWLADPDFENYTALFEGAEARVRGFVIIPRVPFLAWLANSALVLVGSLALTLGAAVPLTLGTVRNEFMLASICLLDPEKQTVAAGLGVMDVSLEELVAVAGVNLAAIPVVAVCALFARTYVRGLTAAMLEGA